MQVELFLLMPCNGLSDMRHLAMLWAMWHYFPDGARFAFNLYHHWAHLILYRPMQAPDIFLIREGVNQVKYLYMVFHVINLAPLV